MCVTSYYVFLQDTAKKMVKSLELSVFTSWRRETFFSLVKLCKTFHYHHLGETIQSETHDSTEDAQTALKLYFKYKQMGTDKEAKVQIQDLYEKG